MAFSASHVNSDLSHVTCCSCCRYHCNPPKPTRGPAKAGEVPASTSKVREREWREGVERGGGREGESEKERGNEEGVKFNADGKWRKE